MTKIQNPKPVAIDTSKKEENPKRKIIVNPKPKK